MAKFSKSQLKTSLLKGLSLVKHTERVDDYNWLSFDQLPLAYKNGYQLVNDKKHNLLTKKYKKLLK